MADPFADIPRSGAAGQQQQVNPFADIPRVRAAPQSNPFEDIPRSKPQGSPPVSSEPLPVSSLKVVPQGPRRPVSVAPDSASADIPPRQPRPAPVSASDEDIFQRLIRSGHKPVVAAGILANAKREGGGDYGAVNKESGAIGMWQWLGPRKAALMAFAKEKGRDWKDPDIQHAFLDREIYSNPVLVQHLRQASTPEDAAKVFNEEFEKPGNMAAESVKRSSLAGALFKSLPKELTSVDTLRRVGRAAWEGAKDAMRGVELPEPPTALIRGEGLGAEALQEAEFLAKILALAGQTGQAAVQAVTGAIGQHLKEGGYDPTKADQLTRDLAGMAQFSPIARVMLPAVRLPSGRVAKGKAGGVHNDIPEAAAEGAERGFVDETGKFLTREEAGAKAQAAGLDVPDNLHSQDLNKAVAEQVPPPVSPPPPPGSQTVAAGPGGGPPPGSPPPIPPSVPPQSPVARFAPGRPIASKPEGVSFWQAIRGTISPTTMDKHARFAEQTIRRERGWQHRDVASTQARLEKIGSAQPTTVAGRLHKLIMPEQSFLRPIIADAQKYTYEARKGNVRPDEPELYKFWDHMEGKGPKPTDPNLSEFAKASRDILRKKQAELAEPS